MLLTWLCSLQVITKLLYLLCQGDNFTKVRSRFLSQMHDLQGVVWDRRAASSNSSAHSALWRWQGRLSAGRSVHTCRAMPQTADAQEQLGLAGVLTLLSQTPQKEATDVFFSVTKLYQSKDANLRRMVFLMIKETCPDPGKTP